MDGVCKASRLNSYSGKSLVNWPRDRSCCQPIGRLALKFAARDMKVHPVTFHVFLSFAATVCELFTRWLHEMNPLGSGNIPSHGPIHLCNA